MLLARLLFMGLASLFVLVILATFHSLIEATRGRRGFISERLLAPAAYVYARTVGASHFFQKFGRPLQSRPKVCQNPKCATHATMKTNTTRSCTVHALYAQCVTQGCIFFQKRKNIERLHSNEEGLHVE
jgi:hypothetical protein